ncbi:N-acetylneuraminate lyase [Treponema sp. OttesenSCG-928-L16]|nr:N-acetylneuraminate lyase [Treponema sp. OttesenSCG-928-L16]
MEKLKGIIAALVTPFDNSGKVDTEALKGHVKDLLAQGIHGFYVCGSTGEAFLMDGTERKKTLEAVVEANEGRGSVICQCGAVGTDLSIDLGKHAASLGVDAISSVPPFYYNFSAGEIEGYYHDIADACGMPVIVYNIPSMSGVTITPALMSSLRKHPGIVGLKFTSNDFFAMEQIKSADPELIVYNGFDEMALAGFGMGADGAIGSTYNVMGKYFLKIQTLLKENKLGEAFEIQKKANTVIAALAGTGKFFSCLKYIISLRGIPYGSCRRPFTPLTDEDKALCRTIFDKLKKDGAA